MSESVFCFNAEFWGYSCRDVNFPLQLQLKTTANPVHLVNPVKRIPGNGVESFCLARSSLSSAKFFWEGSIAKPDESLRTLRSLRRKEGLVEGVEEL